MLCHIILLFYFNSIFNKIQPIIEYPLKDTLIEAVLQLAALHKHISPRAPNHVEFFPHRLTSSSPQDLIKTLLLSTSEYPSNFMQDFAQGILSVSSSL